MADDVRVWSDELARDPSSLVFLPLAETLRRQGQVDMARKVATRGLERHPHNPEAHDILARIHADRGDLPAAFTEWDMVRQLVPGHVGALKGMAFVRFQQGEHGEAERLLMQAQSSDGGEDMSAVIATVRRSSMAMPALVVKASLPADPHMLFADLLAADQTAMLLDHEGLVLAGSYYASDGRDVGQEVGASLSGVSDEAFRATRHLGIGAWRSIVFETEAVVVALAPAPDHHTLSSGALVVVAVAPDTPLGLLRRMLDKSIGRVFDWLSERNA